MMARIVGSGGYPGSDSETLEDAESLGTPTFPLNTCKNFQKVISQFRSLRLNYRKTYITNGRGRQLGMQTTATTKGSCDATELAEFAIFSARLSPWRLQPPKPLVPKSNTSLARPACVPHGRSLQIAHTEHPFRAPLLSRHGA